MPAAACPGRPGPACRGGRRCAGPATEDVRSASGRPRARRAVGRRAPHGARCRHGRSGGRWPSPAAHPGGSCRRRPPGHAVPAAGPGCAAGRAGGGCTACSWSAAHIQRWSSRYAGCGRWPRALKGRRIWPMSGPDSRATTAASRSAAGSPNSSAQKRCRVLVFSSRAIGPGLYDTTSWKPGWACTTSSRWASGSMRRVSVSGWITTVASARASTSSSRSQIAPCLAARVSGPSCQRVPSASSNQRPTRSPALRSS